MTLATFLDDLSQDLETAGFGTEGTDIFTLGLSETSPSGISLAPYGGTNPIEVKSGEENQHNPYLNVFVRNVDKQACHSKAFQIYEHWRLLHNVRIGSTFFTIIKARGTPQFAGLSKMSYPEYSINFELKFVGD